MNCDNEGGTAQSRWCGPGSGKGKTARLCHMVRLASGVALNGATRRAEIRTPARDRRLVEGWFQWPEWISLW